MSGSSSGSPNADRPEKPAAIPVTDERMTPGDIDVPAPAAKAKAAATTTKKPAKPVRSIPSSWNAPCRIATPAAATPVQLNPRCPSCRLQPIRCMLQSRDCMAREPMREESRSASLIERSPSLDIRCLLEEASFTARHLLTLFDSVYLAALSIWIGGAIFFMVGIGPVLFRAIGVESAVALIRIVYPRYYAGCAIAGAVALAAFVAGPLCYHEYRGPMIAVQSLAIIFAIVLMFYGGILWRPPICAARRDARPNRGALERLQHRALVINLVALVTACALLAAHTARPAPDVGNRGNVAGSAPDTRPK